MKKTFSILIVLAITCAVNAQTKTNAPKLHLDKETVDYGVVKKGSDRIRTLKVTNKGSAPLLITSCDGSCSCTIPTCPREPILPGKSAEIPINYDTNRIGLISKAINIKSNDPDSPVKVVQVKGEVKDENSKS